MTVLETSVLIVGAGPAGPDGRTRADRVRRALSHIERQPGTAHTPRAYLVNQRTVEIMRHLASKKRSKQSLRHTSRCGTASGTPR
ncbi:FAD-dependent monooxygenase [Amycolatopsis sp.]|uniref:FAD-dependent monooxygenase n=1 Tax=Amycolatopsis sp. TaxID=37632 RepID=UPI0039C8B3F0